MRSCNDRITSYVAFKRAVETSAVTAKLVRRHVKTILPVIRESVFFGPIALVVAILAAPPASANDEAVSRVRTASLSSIAIYPERSAAASVVSDNEGRISAEIAARVTEITVRVGDVVEAGTPIARLDCQDYSNARKESQASLAAIDARLKLAERRLTRTERLARQRNASEESLDERRAELDALRADRRAAETRLEMTYTSEGRCAVRSPFRALVLERTAAVGEYASTGTPLVSLIDIERLEVSAQVPVQDVALLKTEHGVSFKHDEQSYPLQVRTIVAAVDTQTRTQEVRLAFKSETALPGTAGRLVWRDPRSHVDPGLLVRRNGTLGIFAVKGSRARFIPVPTAQVGRPSPVELDPDTAIVIEGYLALRDDAVITVDD